MRIKRFLEVLYLYRHKFLIDIKLLRNIPPKATISNANLGSAPTSLAVDPFLA